MDATYPLVAESHNSEEGSGYMFERYTDRARRIVVLAQEEAREFNHEAIGTEHLLLGLLSEGEGVAGLSLKDVGADLKKARKAVLKRHPKGEKPLEGHMPFTPKSKKMLELALREALQLGHNYIGTEHILLGLCRLGEGRGMEVMETFAPATDVRQAVIKRLMGDQPKPEPRPATERNVFLWVRAGQEIETPEGMRFRSVVATRVATDLYTSQYHDETLLWFSADAVEGPPRVYEVTMTA